MPIQSVAVAEVRPIAERACPPLWPCEGPSRIGETYVGVMRHPQSLLISALAVLVCAYPATAKGNGIDLPKRVGEPGERIQVVGHDWLTCCPRNTPVEHVELYLAIGFGIAAAAAVAGAPHPEGSCSSFA